MELKYAQITGTRLLINVGPVVSPSGSQSLIYVYLDASANKMYIHFWRNGKHNELYVPTNVSKSEFFKWNKKGVLRNDP